MRFAAVLVIPRVVWGAAGALFCALLWSLFSVENVPMPVAVGLFGLAGMTTWRPDRGLIVMAMCVPIASWFGRTWNWTVAWPETLVVAFLLGYAVRQTFEQRRQQPDALVLAIHSMIAVVAVSLLVQFLVLRDTIGGEALSGQLSQMLSASFFVSHGGFPSVDAAARLIEGLLLVHAAAGLARRAPAFPPLLARTVVIGAVAASALNLWRVWLGARRLDAPVMVFFRYLGTLRYNTHYADVNAAGSYYVMTLLPALALARHRVRWIVCALIIGVSFMMSGSRAAMIAGVAAAAFVWWIRRPKGFRQEPGRDRRTAGVRTYLLLAVMCAAAVYLGFRRNTTTATTALGIRAELARTSLRMLESRPLFGIGVGQFHIRSGEFSSPEIRANYPHENAHNNFLQILAELGTVGFAAFTWLLALAGMRILPLTSIHGERLLPQALAAGLLAFVLTWLAGHPLLIDAPAFSFWLLLGAATGWGMIALADAPIATAMRLKWAALAGPRAARWASLAFLIALAASVPIRVRQEIGAANLEHVGIGLSGWQTGGDGVQYRLAGVTSTVFVPSKATVVTLPLKSFVPDAELQVELRLDGHDADVVRVPPDDWRVLTIQVPQRRDDRRFRPLELRVRDGSRREPPLLMVGKVQPR